MIPIDKDVPLPQDAHAQYRTNAKYPWKTMEVGDSFEVPNLKVTSAGPMASMAGKRLGRKFTARATPNGSRIWRIA